MILVKAEEIPLTIVAKVLVVVLNVLELMIVEVPIDPPKLEVKVLAEDERVLFTFKLVTLKLVVVALVNIRLSLNVYFTSPLVVVETIKLLLVDEAKKV
jgi:hypothetical protein